MKDRPGMSDDRWREIQADRTWGNAHPVSDDTLPPCGICERAGLDHSRMVEMWGDR